MTEQVEYRSTITPRSPFSRGIGHFGSTQSLSLPMASGNRMIKMVESFASGYSSGSAFGSSAWAIRDTKEKEKKELCELNDRLANFIERVRFLEAQNRKLTLDLEGLKKRTGKGTTVIKSMFEKEIESATSLIGNTTDEKKKMGQDLAQIEKELKELRKKYENGLKERKEDKEKIDELLVQLSNLESEVSILKRRIELLESEVQRLKKENQRLQAELHRIRQAVDRETLNRIDYQNKVQTLLEEIEFFRRDHEGEIKDLQAQAARDTTGENREYFRNELANAIREIRNEYDALNSTNRNDIESWYRVKVQEIETQAARNNMEQGYQKEEKRRLRDQLTEVRNKLADLEGKNAMYEQQIIALTYQVEDERRHYEDTLNMKDDEIRKAKEECQALMVELQMLIDAKQTLDSEIMIYRQMLEGEGNEAGLRHLVEQVVKTTGINEVADTETMRVVKGETSIHHGFSRSAKGNVSIQETDPDGKYVLLENTHRSKEEAIGEWKLKRKIDGKREIVYTFPQEFVLRPASTFQIWARNQGGIHNPPEQVVFEGEDTFGVGSNITTILYNTQGEERATLTQKQSQSSHH
ncbi:unnamed protein product [Bursaphelenchus xylophilus]|uniref:(pine wood nematode) hypothetical protein n=1 Tax=Bursaphelenchus xylophilus TaxID=6326 RepID=A0A7I8WJB5_BURXY|nr:unnamed protein product [Bursaphelenchus xylophilus]CAG9108212.1 unnamed protein product [Bursaphelenchus xylophilus]